MLASGKETRDSGVLHARERRVKMIFLWRQVEGERVTCPKSTQDMGNVLASDSGVNLAPHQLYYLGLLL